MVTRKIVHIDEELCNGCGDCIPNCAEGALKLVDGKATIVNDVYCDGLGACLGHCPKGAISIIERETAAFDQQAVHKHLSKENSREEKRFAAPQWPVKLTFVPLKAPFYEDVDLLVTADCVPAAVPNIHEILLKGRRIVIGCPKFDDVKASAHKLGEILKRNNVRSITIAHMEVPCCSGLNWIVNKAVEASMKQIPVERYIITVGGDLK